MKFMYGSTHITEVSYNTYHKNPSKNINNVCKRPLKLTKLNQNHNGLTNFCVSSPHQVFAKLVP
jgi:hypothetical protein